MSSRLQMQIQNPVKCLRWSVQQKNPGSEPLIISQNRPSLMFDRVPNMLLDYLRCFAVVIGGIHGKVDSKHWLKKNGQLLNLMC